MTPLVAYALRGLGHCWMPEHGRWSHRHHLDGRDPPNESLPPSDIYYSLNVLLGLARLGGAEAARARQLFPPLAAALLALPDRSAGWALPLLGGPDLALLRAGWRVRRYSLGMALWAAAELDVAVPGALMDRVRALLAEPGALRAATAQEVGLLLSGLAAQGRRDAALLAAARPLRDLLLARFVARSGLLFDAGAGPRRGLSSFASQVYGAMALFQADAAWGDPAARAAASACVARLIALQGPRGEWPWFFHAPSGRVLDFYEVYAVHQHGMAPALLHHAIAAGVPGARAALVRGFEWLFGGNEMGVSMLRPERGLILRSQARAGLAGRRDARFATAAWRAATGGSGRLSGQGLRLTLETRSYELGWTLFSFGGRADFPELTGRPEFSPAA
jgi:hypothetical protein